MLEVRAVPCLILFSDLLHLPADRAGTVPAYRQPLHQCRSHCPAGYTVDKRLMQSPDVAETISVFTGGELTEPCQPCCQEDRHSLPELQARKSNAAAAC